jgi:glycosyltransferase involved in cell wall biosynthesis
LKGNIIECRKSEGPFFSIIVPTYNHARYLPDALNSLLAQGCPDWEAVLVNDGSTDASPAVMERYAAADQRFRVVHKANGGVSSALNEGLRQASGQWICWLSSDDFFEPDKLEVSLEAIRDNPGIRFFYSHFSFFDDKTGVKSAPYPKFDRQVPSPPLQSVSFLKWNYVHGNSITVHRSVFEEVGFFNERLRSGQDFEMWLRISIRFPFFFTNRRTCITRVHPGQGTAIFPEAGVFDGTRACVDLLNAHRFRDLFPFLDIASEAGALDAARAVIDVSKDPGAVINRCGHNAALLERFHEYLSGECPVPVRESLAGMLDRMIRPILKGPIPDHAKWPFRVLRDGGLNGYRFVPHDFLTETIHNARRFFWNGKHKEAEQLKRYLRILCTVSESDRIRIDSERIDEWGPAGKGPGRARKILLVTSGLPPLRIGGAERYARTIAKALSARGHDVAVLSANDCGEGPLPRIREGSDGRIRLYEIDCADGAAPENSIRNRKVEKLFRNILLKERFDIVHFHHTYRLPFSLLNIAKSHGSPVCLSLSDWWFLCPRVQIHNEAGQELCTGPVSIQNCARCLIAETSPAGNDRAVEPFIAYRREYVRESLEKIDVVAVPSAHMANVFKSCGFGRGKIVVSPPGSDAPENGVEFAEVEQWLETYARIETGGSKSPETSRWLGRLKMVLRRT